MIKLIQFIWSGCWHIWKDTERINLTRYGDVVGVRYIQQCTECGNRRRIDLHD